MKYLAPLTFCIGFAFFSCGVSTSVLVLGSVFIGIANGVGMPYLNTIASIKGGKDAATTVMPLISAALYLGQFTSPLIVSTLATFIPSTTGPYVVGLLFSLAFLFQAFYSRKYQALFPSKEN